MKKLYKSINWINAMLGFCLTVSGAFAQGNGPLTSKLVEQKVIIKSGVETLISADQSKPGDVIQYTATFKNVGSRDLSNLGLTIPIPDGMVCLSNSVVSGSVLEASLDRQNFSIAPLVRKVTTEGRNERQSVPVSDYRALRWVLGKLEAGTSVSVSLRALVSANSSNVAIVNK